MCKSPLFKSYFFWILLSLCLWRTGGGWITAYSLRNVFSTATDGGVSIQKHVLLFAKRAIKPVQGRTGLIVPRFPLVSFCRCCSAPAVFFRFRSKNRACFIQASKRIPLQSLSVSNRPYICTHPPYRRNWLWGNTKIITPLFHKNISALYSTLSNPPIFQAVCGMQTNSFPYPILS